MYCSAVEVSIGEQPLFCWAFYKKNFSSSHSFLAFCTTSFSAFYLFIFKIFFFMYFHFSTADLWSVVQESKSIGAEVNWGVRFRDLKDVSTLIYCMNRKKKLSINRTFDIIEISISISFFRVITSFQIYARRFLYACKDVQCRAVLLPLRYSPLYIFDPNM